MNNHIFLYLLLLPVLANSQTFEKIIQLAEIVRPNSLIETNNGYIVATRVSEISNSNARQSNLLYLNQKGEIILNKEFRSYYMQTITDLWNINDSTIGVLSYVTVHPDSLIKIVYYQLDSELNIKFQTEYNTDIILNSYLITDICTKKNNNLVYQLSYFYNNYQKKGYYFLEFSKKGEVIKENSYQSYYSPSRACITTKPDSGYYMFQGGMQYSLDTMFNIIDSLDFGPNFENTTPSYSLIGDVIWENDSTLVMSVPYNGDIDNHYYYMGISRTRNGKDVIEDKFYDWNELYEMYPYYNSIDTVDNYFYLAATTNFSGGSIFEERYTGIRIIKANKDFSINWDNTYRQDANNYMFYMIGTRDGGCMIAGTRYDFSQPEQRLDLYLLKVDSLGNYNTVSVNEGNPVAQNIEVYPNPGTSELNISFSNLGQEAVFTLYSIAGQKVMSQTLETEQSQIATGQLPNGLYVYELSQNGVAVDRGKWVKQ